MSFPDPREHPAGFSALLAPLFQGYRCVASRAKAPFASRLLHCLLFPSLGPRPTPAPLLCPFRAVSRGPKAGRPGHIPRPTAWRDRGPLCPLRWAWNGKHETRWAAIKQGSAKRPALPSPSGSPALLSPTRPSRPLAAPGWRLEIGPARKVLSTRNGPGWSNRPERDGAPTATEQTRPGLIRGSTHQSPVGRQLLQC